MTRQERNAAAIATLHPVFARLIEDLVLDLESITSLKTRALFGPLIVQARRDRATQQKLYDDFLAGGPRAAPPGRSWHELGLAVDLVDVAGGVERDRYDPADWEATDYGVIAQRALMFGMVAGHLWTKQDSPHLEWHPGWRADQARDVALMFPDGIVPPTFFARRAGADA